MKKIIEKLKKYFPISLRGWLVFFISLGLASLLCVLLRSLVTSDYHVPLIFVLAVLVISLMTDGYFYGILSSIVSVIGVNYAFTYPYFKLDFSVYGYPITFITMLAVGIAVSTLLTRAKEQDKIRMTAEKEKVRANLLRAVSHDLRTPLTSISGSISAVLDSEKLTDSEKRELLSVAKYDAEWLNRMVENLLSITRMSGAEMPRLNKDDEIIEEVISESVLNFRKKNPGIEVNVSIPDKALFVPMDAMLIEQVLLNLMENAVSHGNIVSRIDIDVRETEGLALISVSDNGRGISSDTFNHLFDGTLQPGGESNNDKKRSMGIGLLLCRTIIEAHGGTIYAENIPGSGARFIFTLDLGAENT